MEWNESLKVIGYISLLTASNLLLERAVASESEIEEIIKKTEEISIKQRVVKQTVEASKISDFIQKNIENVGPDDLFVFDYNETIRHDMDYDHVILDENLDEVINKLTNQGAKVALMSLLYPKDVNFGAIGRISSFLDGFNFTKNYFNNLSDKENIITLKIKGISLQQPPPDKLSNKKYMLDLEGMGFEKITLIVKDGIIIFGHMFKGFEGVIIKGPLLQYLLNNELANEQKKPKRIFFFDDTKEQVESIEAFFGDDKDITDLTLVTVVKE